MNNKNSAQTCAKAFTEHLEYRIFPKVTVFTVLALSLLAIACSSDTHLRIDTIKLSPQPVVTQANKQVKVNIEFLVDRKVEKCRNTDRGTIEFTFSKDPKTPLDWLNSPEIQPYPIPFSGSMRKKDDKDKCYAEATLSFKVLEFAPLGLQRLKVDLQTNAFGKEKKQKVDFLIKITP